jgi:hypothetical protein
MSQQMQVLEQIDPNTQEKIEKLQDNYAVAYDGSLVKINDYLENPETPRDETK